MFFHNTNTKEKALRALERQLARLEWVAGFFFHTTSIGSPGSGEIMIIISSAPATAEQRRTLDGFFAEYRSRGGIELGYSVLTPADSLTLTNA